MFIPALQISFLPEERFFVLKSGCFPVIDIDIPFVFANIMEIYISCKSKGY